jgi:hypothetical protein
MAICPLCGTDPNIKAIHYDSDGTECVTKGHDCHCLHQNGRRIAVGICCGHMLGESLLVEEDAADEKRMKEEKECIHSEK